LVAANPARTQVGYLVATDGRYELRGGADSTITELMTFEFD
jgi:hypothetical protein